MVEIEAERLKQLAAEMAEGLGPCRRDRATPSPAAPSGHELAGRLIELFGGGRIRLTIRRPTLADTFWKLCGRSLDEPEYEE